ncbi:MAG: metal-sulfur cluster assembly factor [Ginsengibacter sp.]
MNLITNDEVKCEQAVESLHGVIDPEIGLNVVDLGLIYQIDFDESSSQIFCRMTLTTQFCPMGESISTGVRNALSEKFPNYSIDVKVVFEPHWSAEKITQKGKDFLNS